MGGGGGGGGHSDPEIRGEGLKEIVFRPFGPHFGPKIRGAAPPGPPPGTTTVWSRYGSVMCLVFSLGNNHVVWSEAKYYYY